MRGQLGPVTHVDGGDEDEPRLLTLDALNRIKDLQRTLVIDLLRALGAAFPSSACRPHDDVRIVKGGCELGDGRVFEREQERRRVRGFDVVSVLGRADDRRYAVFAR